jgi:malate/lactate dehydrogenase
MNRIPPVSYPNKGCAMKKIAIIGSGNFGANAACFIAENRLGNVILVDNKEGLAKG